MFNAACFLILAVVEKALGASSVTLEIAPPVLFFLGSVISFIRLIRNGGELAAVSFFVLGAGIFFGFGTAYSSFVDDPSFRVFFASEDLGQKLSSINLLNASSVMIVLLVAWPLSRTGPKRRTDLKSMRASLGILAPMRLPLLCLSSLVIFLQLATFPLPSNLVLRGLLGNSADLTAVTILLYAVEWSRMTFLRRLPVLVLIFVNVALGVLSLSKLQTFAPLVAMAAGLVLDVRSRKTLLFVVAAGSAAYFLFLADIINFSRFDVQYSAEDNTVSERTEIVYNTWNNGRERLSDVESGSLLQRFATAPVQSFLMQQYNEGIPGTSLSDAWAAAIPRVLWPEKPNITRFGGELDGLYFRRYANQSSLAPTYSAEAYWNWGWLGVLLISTLIGLQVGWFTRKWHRFSLDARRHLGMLIFAVPIVVTYFWLESWVAAAYIGGFATLTILVKVSDVLVPELLRVGRRSNARGVILTPLRRAGR